MSVSNEKSGCDLSPSMPRDKAESFVKKRAAGDESDIHVKNVCQDTISSVKFHPLRSSKLLCSSWDGSVSLYDIKKSRDDWLLCKLDHGVPALDAAFLWNSPASNIIFTGGLQPNLVMHDIHTGSRCNVGYHKSGIQFVEYNPYTDCIITAGFDHSIKCWDARIGPDKPVNWVSQPGLIYAACQRGPFVMAAFRSRNRLMVWDIRKLKWHLPYQRRSLCIRQDPITCLAMSGGCDKFVYGSQYGRVAVEYMGASREEQRKKYVFKCHRHTATAADNKQHADGTKQHADGTKQHTDGSKQHADGTKQQADGTKQHADGTKQHTDGTKQHADGTKQHADRTKQQADGTKQHTDRTKQHADGTKQHADGTKQHADGTKQHAGGTKQQADGTKQHAGGTKQQEAVERAYPVNAACFYADSDIFATGGSDGYVNIWDSGKHKRTFQYKLQHEVTAMSFNNRGQYLAIASSALLNPSRNTSHTIYIKRNSVPN